MICGNYSSTGSVPGISGKVDLNYSYSPFENSNGGGNTNNELLLSTLMD